ncbi:hypothetical protein TNCV_2265371 [Trichonephila clavipes]|nr:hypothetical protein TNCV_2265371 [Trichonephila clavipes]
MAAANFLHQENPPTFAGIESAILGTEDQRQINYATQPANSNLSRTIFPVLMLLKIGCGLDSKTKHLLDGVSHGRSAPIRLISCLLALQSAGSFSTHSGSSSLQTLCRHRSVGKRKVHSTGVLFHPSDCPWEQGTFEHIYIGFGYKYSTYHYGPVIPVIFQKEYKADSDLLEPEDEEIEEPEPEEPEEGFTLPVHVGYKVFNELLRHRTPLPCNINCFSGTIAGGRKRLKSSGVSGAHRTVIVQVNDLTQLLVEVKRDIDRSKLVKGCCERSYTPMSEKLNFDFPPPSQRFDLDPHSV